MADQKTGMMIQNVKEFMNYAEMLKTALESSAAGHQALSTAMEAVSEHARSIVQQGVMEPFSTRYEDAVRILESRVQEHESNLRWRKVFGFAFKEDLAREAWDSAYREFRQLSKAIKRDHLEFLGQVVAARNLMMKQGAEAVRSLLAGQEIGPRKLLAPGSGGNGGDDVPGVNGGRAQRGG